MWYSLQDAQTGACGTICRCRARQSLRTILPHPGNSHTVMSSNGTPWSRAHCPWHDHRCRSIARCSNETTAQHGHWSGRGRATGARAQRGRESRGLFVLLMLIVPLLRLPAELGLLLIIRLLLGFPVSLTSRKGRIEPNRQDKERGVR